MSSRWPQVAKPDCTAAEPKAGGLVFHTIHLRGRDMAKRYEAQGGRRGLLTRQ